MPSGVQVSPWLHPGLCPFLHLCADAAHASLLLFHSYLLQPPSRPLFFPTYLLPSWPPCRLWPCLPLSLSFSGFRVIPPPRRPCCRGRPPCWTGYQLSPLLRDPDLGGGCRGSIRAMGLLAWVWREEAWEGGALPSQPHRPLSFSSRNVPSFPSSASFSLSCLHSPNTHRLLSWVLSHPTHSLPQRPCPPAGHRARPTEPPAAPG